MTAATVQTTIRGQRRASAIDRLLGAGVALACLTVLALAAALRPASEGFGTHEQLGMPPCTWAAYLDRPCPTCGMTTAFAAAANGDVMTSLAAQPFGALLAILTSTVFWGALHVAVTGSQLGRFVSLLLAPRALWIAGLLLAGGWGYKLLTWTGFGG